MIFKIKFIKAKCKQYDKRCYILIKNSQNHISIIHEYVYTFIDQEVNQLKIIRYITIVYSWFLIVIYVKRNAIKIITYNI